MIHLLKDRMAANEYREFMLDYEVLCCIKQSTLWKDTMLLKDSSIFVKSYFDKLKVKYSYTEFKNIIINDKVIHTKIQKEISDKGLQYGCFLLFHYTIEIYISFLIEYILKQEIERELDIKVLTSHYLDISMKCDLLISGKPYQIKNYSFIENNYYIDKRIDNYKKINNNLLFIFYRIERDNIYFVSIDDKLILDIKDINGFTVFSDTKNKTIAEIIKAVSAQSEKEFTQCLK